MMDSRAVNNVVGGGQGQAGKPVLALAVALDNLNLNNSTEEKKKRRNRAKNQQRKRKLQEKALAAATGGENSGQTVVRAATNGNLIGSKIVNGSQKAQNVGGPNTKKQQNQTQSTASTGTTPIGTVKGSSAKSKKTKSKKNGPGNNLKDYRKVLTVYQCENENCKKSWESAHGWTSFSGLYCEDCDARAKVTNKFEGMIWVEDFRCTMNGCNNSWILPRDPENLKPIKECLCGSMVTSGGAQFRSGCQYWLTCQNKDCGTEWEEVTTEKEYTQRCLKCDNPGTKVGTRKETSGEAFARRRRFRSGSGGHNIQGCEMCQKLIHDKVAGSCTRKNRVIMKVVIENGVSSDRIIATE